jgi:hypothetical protein
VTNEIAPVLRPNAADGAASALQTLTSATDIIVPGLGSLFGTLIGTVIPGQRNERLLEYVTRLSRRLALAENGLLTLRERHDELQADLQSADDFWRQAAHRFTAEQTALFEDGAISATRATRGERLDEIVNVVAAGLAATSADDHSIIQKRRILALLSSLDSNELGILRIYNRSPKIKPGDAATNEAHVAFMLDEQAQILSIAGSSNADLQTALARLRAVGAVKSFSLSAGDTPFQNHNITTVGEELVYVVDAKNGTLT